MRHVIIIATVAFAFLQSLSAELVRCPTNCTTAAKTFCLKNNDTDIAACGLTESCPTLIHMSPRLGRSVSKSKRSTNKKLVCPEDCIPLDIQSFCFRFGRDRDRIAECKLTVYCQYLMYRGQG